MIEIALGIGTSLATELITWINKKLSNTPLKGNGAFIVASLIAFVGAAIKLYVVDKVPFDWSSFMHSAGLIFATAQVYFKFVASKLGLTVTH